MEAIRELIPFILGAMITPVILRLIRASNRSSVAQLAITLVLSAGVGYVGSLVVGEQQPVIDLPERVVALVIDTSLAFTGAQIVDQVIWKRGLAQRLGLQHP